MKNQIIPQIRIVYQTVRQTVSAHASFFIVWIMPFLFFNLLCIIPTVQTTLDTQPILMTVQEYLSFPIDGLILAYYFARGLTLARNLNINKKLLSAVFGIPLTIFLTLDILPLVTILTPADRLLLFTVNDYYLHLPIASIMLIFYFALSLYLLLTITKMSYVVSSQIKPPITEYSKVSISAITILTGTLLIIILTFIDRQGLGSLSMLTIVFLCWLYPVTLTATTYYLSLRNKLRSFFDWPNVVAVLFLLLTMKALVTSYSKLQYRLFTLIDNFPRSELGFRIFDISSFPVAFIRAILQYIGIYIPMYLGVAIGISLLVAVWGFIFYLTHRTLTMTNTRAIKINLETWEIRKKAGKKNGGKLGLVFVIIYAIIIRAIPVFRLQTPTGRDTPFYITLMQQRLPESGLAAEYVSQAYGFQLIRITQYFWAVLGSIVGVPDPIPPAQLMLIELIPITFNILITIATYALTISITKNYGIGLIAAVFVASSPSQICQSWGLYDTLLGITASLILLLAYNKAIITQNRKVFFLTYLLAPASALLHPRPFVIVLLAIIAYIAVQALGRLKYREKLWQIKNTILLCLVITLFLLSYFRYRGQLTITGNWLVQQPAASILTIEMTCELINPIIGTLTILGIVNALSDRNDSKILLVMWLLTTYILIHQPLFYIYFWPDIPQLTRFALLFYLPITLLAAIGAGTLLQAFNEIHLPIPHLPPRIIYITVILLTIVFSAYVNANRTLRTDLMPSGYHTFQWIKDAAPPTSIIDSGGYLAAWITYQITINAPREKFLGWRIIVTDHYMITRTPGPPYDTPTYAKIYTDGLNTIYYTKPSYL